MTVVDVKAVEVEDGEHFTLDASSDGLDSEDCEDLADVVGQGAHRIDVALREDPHEGGTVSFEQPLGDGLELAGVRDHDPLLIFGVGQVHVDLADCFEALKSHVRKHVCLDATEEHVVLHFVGLLFFSVIFAFAVRVHDANAKDQFLGVVIVKNAILKEKRKLLRLYDNHFIVCYISLEEILAIT